MSTTPLMSQYHQIKTSNPDTILLFRVGDFFETFDEDAKTASKVLGITLTKRANGEAGNVPLAGFPHHAIDTYLPKLVKAGYRVAICEQMENPKLAKGIVKREVVEVVTPGVTLSDKLLDHKNNNYLAAIHIISDVVGIAFSDVSTGEFFTYEVPLHELVQQIGLINPAEIIISKKQKSIIEPMLIKTNGVVRLTKQDDWIFTIDFTKELLLNHFETKTLRGFGIENLEAGVIAAGAVLNYLKETQKSNLSHIAKVAKYNPSEYMMLDYSTKRNLEITFTMQDGSREGSLFGILDRTETPMGARLLKKWISAPLKQVDLILYRQNSVSELYDNKTLRKNLREEIKEIGDLERLIGKACTNRINPRELVTLKLSLRKLPLIKQLLDNAKAESLVGIRDKLNPLDHIIEKIELGISDTPSVALSDGDVIRSGYNAELDELRDLKYNAKDWIANFQKAERERTGISSLKVNFNKVFGYYIEISNANKDKVPENYIRKQTLVNGERYITPELKNYEDKILNAEEKIATLEYTLYNQIRAFVANDTTKIQENARLIAALDSYVSLAECAEAYNYVRPVINNGNVIDIKDGRHPVVERVLPPGEKFAANDCKLDSTDNQIIILTGPNMAGKSVFLRQIGLIVLLAQIGSFVPAKSAIIGVTDRIYTRVGASDNISAGESTFLVEMQEAANILNHATNKSLILLDEIGRGTSTFDGISIAWAITEYLHDNPKIAAKTLFATHYHELNEMASIFPRIKNFKVEVREYGNKIIFLHKVTSGGADHSYGIQVAHMAGLPTAVTARAKEILMNLENKELTPVEIKKAKVSKLKEKDDYYFSLFEFSDDGLRDEISNISIDSLTPIEALNKLNDLKKKIEKETNE